MLAFVHIEKCGGTTLARTFRRYFGCDHFDIIPRDPEAMLACHDDLRHVLSLRSSTRSVAGHPVRVQCQFEEVVPDIAYVTLLRDPIKRYVSDYRHFVEVLNHPADFERWLDREDRHNFQTRAIAGVDDADAAIEILRERFDLVGTVENYGLFVDNLAQLLRCDTSDLWYRVENRANDRRRSQPLPDLDKYYDRIAHNNRHDKKVYEYVLGTLAPAIDPATCQVFEARPFRPLLARSRLLGNARLTANRLYRNLVYKPSLGHLPVPHALKHYRRIA